MEPSRPIGYTPQRCHFSYAAELASLRLRIVRASFNTDF